jgi:hypothetical protein
VAVASAYFLYIAEGAEDSRLLCLRRMRKAINTQPTIHETTTAPMTPPAIATVGVDALLIGEVGAGNVPLVAGAPGVERYMIVSDTARHATFSYKYKIEKKEDSLTTICFCGENIDCSLGLNRQSAFHR